MRRVEGVIGCEIMGVLTNKLTGDICSGLVQYGQNFIDPNATFAITGPA